jgi:hypothetical protein
MKPAKDRGNRKNMRRLEFTGSPPMPSPAQ